MVLLPRITVLTLILETPPGKQECLGKHWIPSNSQQYVARRTPDSVTIQKIFDERTAAHNDLLRNREFSQWQLLLGTTPTDKSVCENPDMAQCSVEVVDEAAKQRLRVKEASYFENVSKKFIKPDLGGTGQQVNGTGTRDLANTRVRE